VLNQVDYTAISISPTELKIIDAKGNEYTLDLTQPTNITLYKDVLIKKIPIFVTPYIDTVNKAFLSDMRYYLVIDFDPTRILDITTSDGTIMTVNLSEIAKDLNDLLTMYYTPMQYGKFYYLDATNMLSPLKTKIFIIYNNTQININQSYILSRIKSLYNVKVAKALIGTCVDE